MCVCVCVSLQTLPKALIRTDKASPSSILFGIGQLGAEPQCKVPTHKGSPSSLPSRDTSLQSLLWSYPCPAENFRKSDKFPQTCPGKALLCTFATRCTHTMQIKIQKLFPSIRLMHILAAKTHGIPWLVADYLRCPMCVRIKVSHVSCSTRAVYSETTHGIPILIAHYSGYPTCLVILELCLGPRHMGWDTCTHSSLSANPANQPLILKLFCG